MKSNSINFYPTLNDISLSNLRKEIMFTFDYECGDEVASLGFREEDGQIFFDESSNWNCNDYDLKTRIQLHIGNTNILFGENGVSPKNSKLGIALEWYSAQSKIRDMVCANDLVVFGINDYDFVFETNFPKATFSGVITINIVLYLKEKSDLIDENESSLNNDEGVILGVIDKRNVYMTGNGSLFPIRIEQLNANKLWDLQINYEDLDETQLSDGFALILNSNHKDYRFIDPNSKDYCETFSNEIVSNAITLLLIHIKENEGLENINEDAAPGSMMEFIRYCKNTLNINFSSSLDINKSVKGVLEEGDE